MATFLDAFLRAAAASPDRAAVIDGSRTWSYRDLHARAIQLANALRAAGIGPEDRVVVSLQRSADHIAAFIGVLAAGAVYVPLAPDEPEQRRGSVFRQASPRAVLLGSGVDIVPPEGAVVIRVDQLAASAPAVAIEPIDVSPLLAVYCIYTSGSTGEPKGVLVEHRAFGHYLSELGARLELGQNDRYLHTASFAFSASFRHMALPLSHGATVILAGTHDLRDPAALWALAARQGATVLDTVPSYLQKLVEHVEAQRQSIVLDHLRLIVASGEPFRVATARTCLQLGVTVVNGYGQTESIGINSVNKVTADQLTGELVLAGECLPGSVFRLLDDKLAPVADGAVGELYVSGQQMSRGYNRRPDLTAERYVPDPFASPGSRMYRTGDMLRRTPDGLLEYCYRADHLVKIRGNRVELGEVESALRGHPLVREAAVAPVGERGSETLAAFVVYARTGAVEVSELRTYLRRMLPDYMVPGHVLEMSQLPRTVSGKLDRGKLPLDQALAAPRGGPATDTPAAQDGLSPLEQLVARCWAETLGLDQVTREDDFFQLGGDSFQVIEMVSKLEPRLPSPVPLVTLFYMDPTVAGLAAAIEQELGADAATIRYES